MEKALSPEDMQAVTGVGNELTRMVNAAELGRSPGSNTAQNLVSQDMLRRIVGPLGASPASSSAFANNALMQKLMFGANWLASTAEPKVQNRLTQAMLDPQDAARLMQLLGPAQSANPLLINQLAVPTGRAAYAYGKPR